MSEIIKSILRFVYSFSIQILVILVALASFALGRTSVDIPQQEVKITPIPVQSVQASAANSTNRSTSGMLVASINGSKYHFPWCSSAQRIKDENKVWFNSYEEARQGGYTPAANCQGLE